MLRAGTEGSVVEIEAARVRADELATAHDEAARRIAELEQQLSEAAAQGEALAPARAEAEERVLVAEEALRAAEARSAEAEQRAHDIERRLDETEQHAHEVETRLGETQDLIEAAEARATTAVAELDEAGRAAEQTRDALLTAQTEAEEARRRVAELESLPAPIPMEAPPSHGWGRRGRARAGTGPDRGARAVARSRLVARTGHAERIGARRRGP